MALSEYSLEKKADLTALADSIRAKVEAMNSMTVAEMKAAIDGMETGGSLRTGSIDITVNCIWLSEPLRIYYTDATGETKTVELYGYWEEQTSVRIEPLIGSIFAIESSTEDFGSYSGYLPLGTQGDLSTISHEPGIFVGSLCYSDDEWNGWYGQAFISIENY